MILAENNPVTVVMWSLVLIGVLIPGLVVVMRFRRWMQAEDDIPTGSGFTLSDLRELHRNGQMSAEEFEKAKAKIIGAAKTAAATARKPGERAPGLKP